MSFYFSKFRCLRVIPRDSLVLGADPLALRCALHPLSFRGVLMTRLLVRAHTHLLAPRRGRPDRGQTTAEYALVLLGVAAIALLVVAWAADTNRIGRLLDSVLDSILSNVT